MIVPHFAVLVVGVEHLLAAGQGEGVGVQADDDAVAGDLSQRGDVALESGEEGLFISFKIGTGQSWNPKPSTKSRNMAAPASRFISERS